MDFLGVSGSGDWDDGFDNKDLHAQLFSPPVVSGKKLKAARKKQPTPAKKQNISSDTKKHKKNHPSENLQHASLHKVKESNDQHKTEDAKSLETEKHGQTKSRKKRKKKTSENGVPAKKQKLQLTSDNLNQEQASGLIIHQNDQSKATENDGTNNKPSPRKKKRKRKPRNNKFKTPEFGYTPQQTESETGKSGAESKTSTPGPTNLKVQTKVNQNNKEDVTTPSMRLNDRGKIAPLIAEDADQKTKSRNKKDRRNKKRSQGTQDSLCIPEQKVTGEKRTVKTLDKPTALKKGKSSQKGELRARESNDNIHVKDSNNSKQASTPLDGSGSPDDPLEAKCQRTASAQSAKAGRNEGVTSDSEEPLPDLSAKLALKSKMEARLKSAHFRYLNEQLYKTTGSEAHQMMAGDREAFDIYHQGFSQQVKQWPVNPVDEFIEELKSRPASLTVGDFGCGEARIAQSVPQTVHSFDLCALNEHVTVCDIKKVPLKNDSLDVAIFCLSLMGTNWIDYIREANRVLKMKGQLKIAEVASRFASVTDFLKIMKQLGFKRISKDFSNKMFLRFDFSKEAPSKQVALERGEVLKPCLYKRR